MSRHGFIKPEPILDKCAQIRQVTDSPWRWERRHFPPSEEIPMEAFEEEKGQIKKKHRHSPKTKRWSVAKIFRLWTSESYFRAPVLKTREKKNRDLLLFFFKKKNRQRATMLWCFHCVKKNNRAGIDCSFVMKLVTAVFRRGTRD